MATKSQCPLTGPKTGGRPGGGYALSVGYHIPPLRRKRMACALVLGVLLMGGSAAAEICGYPEKGALVVTRSGQVVATFTVGLAETRRQHRQGLMGCHDLAAGTGLLFVYPDGRPRVFWMKDTPLELAILFASPNGRIAAVAKGLPFSTQRIRSPDNIQYVLEIHHAEVGAIRIGDHITLRLIPE